MKTTNILLGFIALFLFLILFRNSDFAFFSSASAQPHGSTKKTTDIIDVRIVDVGTNISGSLPVLYGTKNGVVFPMRSQSDPALLALPVSVVH